MENDTNPGGESLTIDQAAAAYSKSQAEAVREDHAEVEDIEEDGTTTDDELQAADEDAGEVAEGETADADHADDTDDAADEPDSEQGRFVADSARVRIVNPDGTPGYTTVAELKRGSLREADYTQKTQVVSAKEKAVETQSAALQASEKLIDEQRDYVVSLIKSIVPDEPDLLMLETDPHGYMKQKGQREQWLQHLAYLDSEQQRVAKERQAKSGETEKETADREWNALLAKAPELKDEKRLNAFVGDLKKYATDYGYNAAELARLPYDHRNIVVLRKAIAWDKLQASKTQVAKKVEGRPPVQKGGKRLSSNDARARSASDAVAKAQKSGRLEDVAAAYHQSRKGN